MRHKGFALATAVALAFAGAVVAAPDTPKSANVAKSSESSRLLLDIRADAGQVSMHARRIEKLSQGSPTWMDYDRQWNEVEPLVEKMTEHLYTLDGMQTKLSANDQKAVDSARKLAGEISASASNMRRYLDAHGNSPSNSELATYGKALQKDAMELRRAATSS